MENKVFFIAEISANHCGNFNLAKKLIKCARVNGADAVKLQTYTADTMTIQSNKKYFKIKNDEKPDSLITVLLKFINKFDNFIPLYFLSITKVSKNR